MHFTVNRNGDAPSHVHILLLWGSKGLHWRYSMPRHWWHDILWKVCGAVIAICDVYLLATASNYLQNARKRM